MTIQDFFLIKLVGNILLFGEVIIVFNLSIMIKHEYI